MGRRGPKPTPTAILKARGSWRADLREGEPDPGVGAPPLPAWLMSTAKTIWRRLAPQLVAMGVLTTADGDALARYCQTLARWRRCQRVLARSETFLVTTTAGDRVPKARPEVAIAKALTTDLAKLEAQFGLTPSARVTLKVTAIFTPRKVAAPPAPQSEAAPVTPPAPNVIQGKDRFFGGPA